MIVDQTKLYRKSLLASLVVVLFLLAPANAVPSLSVGSYAKYHVSATLHFESSCTADQIQYAGQACGGIIRPIGFLSGGGLNVSSTITTYPITIGPSIRIFDSGSCSMASSSCGFDPSYITVLQGTTVLWVNDGMLAHAVASNATSYGGLLFNSGNIATRGNFSYTFNLPGVYAYYDPSYPWMRGTVNVMAFPNPPPILPPPQPTRFQAEIDGTVGWTVLGIDSANVVLRVDHDLSLSISPSPLITITPIHESGSFEQSIELSTRLESPGTASMIVEHTLGEFMSGLSNIPYSTTGVISSYPTLVRHMGSGAADKSYTVWWVNGPLSLGSPVKILSGFASVTGSRDVTVEPLGLRHAWLVTSNLNEAVNISIPYSGSNQLSASLKLSWAFDQKNDLLLRSEVNASINSLSSSRQTIWPYPCIYTGPGSICPICYGCPTNQQPITVQVTRETSIRLEVTMTLTATSLTEHTNRNGSVSQSDPVPISLLAALSIGSLGAVAAGGVGAGVWFLQRRRHGTNGPTSVPRSTM